MLNIMEGNYFRHLQYIASTQSIYGPLFPVQNFYKWLREDSGQLVSQPLIPASESSKKTWYDTCFNKSTDTNTFGGNKQGRWKKEQTDVSINMWTENITLLESTSSYVIFLKIKTAVHKNGQSKTIK